MNPDEHEKRQGTDRSLPCFGSVSRKRLRKPGDHVSEKRTDLEIIEHDPHKNEGCYLTFDNSTG